MLIVSHHCAWNESFPPLINTPRDPSILSQHRSIYRSFQNIWPALSEIVNQHSRRAGAPRRHQRRRQGHHDRGKTRFQRVLSGVQAGYDMTWSATQVVPRPVEAGLGGHDAGASGDDEGVEKTLIPLWKQGRLALLETPTFIGFVPARKDCFSENQNCIDG